MEKVVTMLRCFGRFRELEVQLPEQRQRLLEAKYGLREARLRTAQTKWELDRLDKGGFLQRLLGNQEEKKEKAYKEYRKAQTEEHSAKQKMEALTSAWEEAEREHKSLSGSWEKFLKEKEAYLTAGGDDGALADALRPILASFAVSEIEACIANLEKARPWMQADVRTSRISPDNQKLEFLGKARDCAEIALQLLNQLPEGSVEIAVYLRSPDGYIMGVTTHYKQLDRLNLAQEQLRRLRNQLREL